MKESGLIKVNPSDYLDNGNGTSEPTRDADHLSIEPRFVIALEAARDNTSSGSQPEHCRLRAPFFVEFEMRDELCWRVDMRFAMRPNSRARHAPRRVAQAKARVA